MPFNKTAHLFQTEGAVLIPLELIADHIPLIRQQASLYESKQQKWRPWHYWELHNPWSRSATVFDSWRFLDLCEYPPLLEHISAFIGNDLILFDSQFWPDLIAHHPPEESWQSDAYRFPVRPTAGLTVCIPLYDGSNDGTQFRFLPGSHISDSSEQPVSSILLTGKNILCYDCQLQYQLIQGSKNNLPEALIIRYFPATSQYLRDESSPFHRALTDQFPLLNYAQLPLWQVAGKDQANNDFVTGFNPKPGRWVR